MIPAAARDDAADTVASVLHYGGPATVAVVQDDTGGDLAHLADGRRVHVRQARGPARGVGGSLWAKLAETYAWALAELDPAIVMKLDADALMTGPGLGDLAAARFAADPALGMLGSYAIGPDGGERDWRPAAIAIRAQAGLRGCGSRPSGAARARCSRRRGGTATRTASTCSARRA